MASASFVLSNPLLGEKASLPLSQNDMRIMKTDSSAATLLTGLLDQLRGAMPDTDRENAMELIEHGELGVALELLCVQLIEHEVPLQSNQLRSLREVANLLSMNESMEAKLAHISVS